MLSSMSPTFLEYGDRVAVLGTPGGSRIISMVLLAALEFHDGGDPMAMAERPRFHHQYLPDVIEFEPVALDAAVRSALQDRGHELDPQDDTWGDMQVVTDDGGEVSGAADPRGIGAVARGIVLEGANGSRILNSILSE